MWKIRQEDSEVGVIISSIFDASIRQLGRLDHLPEIERIDE
jgi:hypothetical protein